MAYNLTDSEKEALRIASIERTINVTIRLLSRMRRYSDPAIAEDADQAWQDWKEHKALVTKLWDRERNSLFSHS